ncbi:TPA: HNH endonuclease signature motif containing protein [Salmonella enterica subsp. enterica serovar Infantis]
MNYQKLYNELIAVCEKRNGKPVSFSTSNTRKGLERHHIKPRSMGGSDDSSNLVYMTYREHYLAHHILAVIYQGDVNHKGIVDAFWFMSNDKVTNIKITSRQYETARNLFVAFMIGNDYRKGIPNSEETRKKISEFNKTRVFTDTHRERISQSKKGVVHNIKTCEHCGKETSEGNYYRWHGDNCPVYTGVKHTRKKDAVEKLKETLSNKIVCPHCDKAVPNHSRRYHFDNCHVITGNKSTHKKHDTVTCPVCEMTVSVKVKNQHFDNCNYMPLSQMMKFDSLGYSYAKISRMCNLSAGRVREIILNEKEKTA